MSAGHGGQILLEALTAGLSDGVDLIDLGEHRLRDMSGTTRLFQVRAEGLSVGFAPVRTMDAAVGNLPLPATSFVGREHELGELVALVRAHRLVTLTGVGGVGKTRLALRVGADLAAEFPDGVWLVELAPVGDPAAVPDAVATVLGVQSGVSATDNLVQALSGRRLLVVLDNCEHVLDAAAALVATMLTRAAAIQVLVTSREGLRVESEQLWAVPSLDTRAGASSAAVALFVERAQAVVTGFSLHDEGDMTAVVEICRRLDGIALAIELAAARMVSMSPSEVLERLADRFRLLAGSRRGVERHQTLRHAVGWSYDLLDQDERALLSACSVFADGFDLVAATRICGAGSDEYTVLDLLDSLVRKSLIGVEHVGGHTRYRMLETIRQYAEDQLGEIGDELRDRHASYFAREARARWDTWNGPGQRVALDWVDVEFANLRTGFRWAADRGDHATATAIAAHTAMLAFTLRRYEPVGWAEELLDAGADVHQLPRLYTAASLCEFTGQPTRALEYAQHALRLEGEGCHEPFEIGWSSFLQSTAHRFTGELETSMEICADMATQTGFARAVGMAGFLYSLPNLGRSSEARAVADEIAVAVRATANPWLIAFMLDGYGRAFAEAEPARALTVLREGLEYTREHRIGLIEAFFVRDVAALEAAHGEIERALALFETNIDSLHRAGGVTHLLSTLASLAVLFDRIDRPHVAATIYGTTTGQATLMRVVNLSVVLEHLRDELGQIEFDRCVDAGAAMELADAVHYARLQIELARHDS